MNTHAGYSKKTLTDTNVLLAGGGDKSLADFLGGIQYVSASHKILYRAADTNTWSDLVTLVTTDENVKQTPKTDNVNRPLMMINGGTLTGELTSTSMFSTGMYANASTNTITATGNILAGGIIGCTKTAGNHTYGLSLYGAPNYVASWGITAGLTSTGGKYGDVTDDWALYFHCSGATTRGFIFTNGLNNNVASISSRGYATFLNVFVNISNYSLGINTSNYSIGTDIKQGITISNSSYGSGSGVADGNSYGINFTTGNASQAGIYCQTSGSYGTRLIFGTTSSYANGVYARMIITHIGYVGILTMSPSYPLHVNGNVGATHYYETSDIRLKHDISSISQSIRKFQFNNDNKLYYGFIAQELETLHPELVDSSGEYKTVNYNSAICYYIAELENKVQKLEDRLSKLEK